MRDFDVIYAEPENKTWAGFGFKPSPKFRAVGFKRNGNFRFKIFLSKNGSFLGSKIFPIMSWKNIIK